ncbi:hypothetical protein [Alteromonas mediterranea]|uniref:hypothetical protein n=1 Tax=Alteromonas mediterranea TaxID=314275 RepID=UPI000B1A4F46|nr:hypothetical protein [Alteromonas mediterranea]
MNIKQFFSHSVIFLFLVIELTVYLQPAFQVGSLFDLNIHQTSYIFYIGVQILLLQASMFLGEKNYKLVLCMLFAHVLSSSIFLYFEHFWIQLGLDSLQFYYALQVMAMIPYLFVLGAFRKQRTELLYKLMSFNYLSSLILVIYYAIFPESNSNVFVATSVTVYFLYCTQIVNVCIKAYIAAFNVESNKNANYSNKPAFNI